MKTLENLFIKNASGIKFFSFLLVVLFVFSCSKEESLITMADEPSDATLKKLIVQGDYCLEGTSHFDIYAVKEKIVLSDGDAAPLVCTAYLEIDGQNLTLETKEYFGPVNPDNLYREVTFIGKMTPGGVVMFSWPETWKEFGVEIGSDVYNVLDQVKLHLGCSNLYGPGINKGTLNYKGHFDGTNFYASTHFIGKQEDPGLDGPIQFEFSFNLTKVD